ncbi:hypothetical protein BCR43DRAFT_221324 [Syncephalastrum racemosum]|uniref:Uncharacterized protein n=1 Tax=Syncephalastrum racemosum TaxID=13706 RepID=A0A1X2HJG2_SYNRA|nr:hypothetical protein BCR43DRAFT_221324 [Syncephalastrum racemosum]
MGEDRKGKRRTSVSSLNVERLRVKAADVEWRLPNAAGLSVKVFATQFRHYSRPGDVVSTVVQLKFSPHLGYGEVEPGDNSTTKQSLCIVTVKLAVLSKGARQSKQSILGE